MNNDQIIITVASWEPRFWLGFERLVARQLPKQVYMYFYKEYATNTEPSRKKVRDFCQNNQIILYELGLSFSDPVYSCRTLYKSVGLADLAGKNLVVDITTMPRETIWILLSLIDGVCKSTTWAYHRPEKYNDDWLSRDPSQPRFVPKLGGVTKLGIPTKLLILSGFDIERTKQVITFYEPELTLIGWQQGSQFNNQSMNILKHEEEFKKCPDVKIFEINAYSADHGYAAVELQLKEHVQDSNVIMASFGPKPSAIALHRLHKLYSQTSLAYAPSKEFNPNYSYGIGDSIIETL
jgi:hypothetical protein